jgi:hypothetical protein
MPAVHAPFGFAVADEKDFRLGHAQIPMSSADAEGIER